ncbi:MAG: hypothetical protein ABSG41_07030 [Bryobacteraceae bacterium]|jgi:hypothetical protein
MDFEEKIDALRMNLELAFHDIEAMGVKIEALRVASASQYESIQVLAGASEALLKNATSQQGELEVLKKMSAHLATLVDAHDRRIGAIEGRI